MIRYDQKVRGIDNRLCGFCYMDYDSPGKEAEPMKWSKKKPDRKMITFIIPVV